MIIYVRINNHTKKFSDTLSHKIAGFRQSLKRLDKHQQEMER